MILSLVLSAIGILIAWIACDTLLHRFLLHPLYAENPSLWRPLDQMNMPLVYAVTWVLIAVFVLTYWLLISPKSLGAGLLFGGLLGCALGVGSGFGTYIHMPVPRGLAWGWFLGGWLKGLLAGAILGLLVAG
ncbi:hypothetical protein F8S13_12570 [Chloroflexia bacterium SDU3-3]|nr:hypothetical protein F8S13_12570 [Chloroflexia bacterium SDU3-3]